MVSRNRYLRALLLLSDVILLESLFFLAYYWRFQTGIFANPVFFTIQEILFPSIVVTFFWLILLSWFGLYRFDPLQSRAVVAGQSFKAVAVGVLILFILTFDPRQPLPSTRIVLASYGIALFVIVGGNRIVLLTLLRQLRLHGIGRFRVLLVGTGYRAKSLLKYVSTHPGLGFDVSGALSGIGNDTHPQIGIPRVGKYSSLRQVLRKEGYSIVLLSVDTFEEHLLPRLVRLLREARVRTFIPADQYRLLIGEVKPTRIPGHPLVDVRPELLSLVERIFKRLTDVLFSLVILVLTAPLWTLLFFLIPLTSAGPIFYKQRRVGLNGHPFTLLKFRSMYHDAERLTGPVLTQENDPRVTKIGRFIRRTRIDELPQLLNVLIGQMSIVGPRPERAEFVEKFVKEIPLYERRLNVKPGLTGWSQVHLKYDSKADQIDIKLQHDFYYIENMSLPLDLKIVFMTMFVVLRGEGI
ncbi:MAG: sugar transferase [Calditrichota bacterium]